MIRGSTVWWTRGELPIKATQNTTLAGNVVNRAEGHQGWQTRSTRVQLTLELGVDIGDLFTVLLRNAPPTPANYKLLELNEYELLRALIGLPNQIEAGARKGIVYYRGTGDFNNEFVHDVLKQRMLNFSKRDPLGLENPQFEALAAGKIYAFRNGKAFQPAFSRRSLRTVRPRKHFAAFEMPRCVDLNKCSPLFPKAPLWRAVYHKFSEGFAILQTSANLASSRFIEYRNIFGVISRNRYGYKSKPVFRKRAACHSDSANVCKLAGSQIEKETEEIAIFPAESAELRRNGNRWISVDVFLVSFLNS